MSKLTIDDYKSFGRLSENKDFQRWVKEVDDFQLRRAQNLISGTESEKDSSIEELKSYRGGHKLWKKALELVEKSTESIKLIEDEKGNRKED